MEVILDTNFVIYCIKEKIDFISQLKEMGFQIVMPREVFQELKNLKTKTGTKRVDKESIDIALKMFSEGDVKKVSLGNNTYADEGLIKKGKEGVYIATLDAGIRRNVPNRVIILNAQKRVAIERD